MTFQTVFFNSGSILTVRFYFFQDNFRFIRPKRQRCGTQQAGCKHLHRATYSKFKLFAPFFRGHCCDVMQLQIMRHMQWWASIILKERSDLFIHGVINYKDTKAKCRHLKNGPIKGRGMHGVHLLLCNTDCGLSCKAIRVAQITDLRLSFWYPGCHRRALPAD